MWLASFAVLAAPAPKVSEMRTQALVPLVMTETSTVALTGAVPSMAYIEKGVVKVLRPKMTKPLSLGVVNEHSKLSFTHDGAFLVGQRDMSVVAMSTHEEGPEVVISGPLRVRPSAFVVGARKVVLRDSTDWLYMTDIQGTRPVRIPLPPPMFPEAGCAAGNAAVEFSRDDAWLLIQSGCSFKLIKVETIEVRDVDATSARFVGDLLVSHNDRAHPMNFVVNLVGRRPRRVAIPATALDVLDLSTNKRWSIEGVTMAGAVLLEEEQRLVSLTRTEAKFVDLRARTFTTVKLDGFSAAFVRGRLFVLRMGGATDGDHPVDLCEVDMKGSHRVLTSFRAIVASFETPRGDPQLVLVQVGTKEGGYVLEVVGEGLIKWVVPEGSVSPNVMGTTWVGRSLSGVFGAPRIWR
ncbi:MAG: hypothetical protein Q8N26_33965 [Myxococcales bacterium]|nr:hypothetical protein [Myxococcales bacterium]